MSDLCYNTLRVVVREKIPEALSIEVGSTGAMIALDPFNHLIGIDFAGQKDLVVCDTDHIDMILN